MGRESTTQISLAGRTGAGKIVLEATELILRGEIRHRFARTDLKGFAVEGDDLLIDTDLGPLRAHLGSKEAAAWCRALAKPAPTLAQKLGIGPATPARLLGAVSDSCLQEALQGNTADQAPIVIAELNDAPALDRAMADLARTDFSHFWAVTCKGKGAALPEAQLRDRLRAAGYIDTKSCAVSEIRSATRFQRR